MAKITTYEQALNKIKEIKRDKKVVVANFYENKDEPWEYYFSLCGWFNGNYFNVYLTGARGVYQIEIPKHVTKQKTLFKKHFKLS